MLLFAFAAAWLGGCAAGGRPSRDPNTLVILELGDADTLDPLFYNQEYSAAYSFLIFDQLVNTGPGFKDVPDLATSWHSTPDGLHWTVDLRRGVRWSDGAPFTSNDVVYTWKAQLDPATGFPYRGQFLYVKRVTAEGPYRVRFDLSSRNALFPTGNGGLGLPVLPEHVLGKIPFAHLRASGFGEHPIGTGPYILKEWRHDESLTFVPNPYWWGGTPKIKRIVSQVVLNEQARTEAMERNEADVDDGIATSTYQIITDDKKAGRTNLLLAHVPDLYDYFIYLNFKRPGLEDVVVRRAMMYGWDRKAMIDGLYHGDALMMTSIVPAALERWYDPNVVPYPYDPQRARAMLDAAGYKLGPDGIRRKGNVRLAYVLSVAGNGGAGDVPAEFQADMRSIGVGITIQTLDYATFIDKSNTGDYELSFSGWGGVPDPDQETLLGCDQFPPNGNNVMFYCNPRMNRDVHLGLEAIQYTQRKRIYDDMQRIFAQDVPVLMFYYTYYRAAINPRVHFDPAYAMPDQYLYRYMATWTLGPL